MTRTSTLALALVAAATIGASAIPSGVSAQPTPAPQPAPAAATMAPPAAPAPSAAPAGSMAPASPEAAPKARFSAVTAYTGDPDLPVTLSMIVAGGGAGAFDSSKLFAVLAGDKTQAEVGSLQQKFGADSVKSFLNVFTFVVDQSLRYVYGAKVQLPAQPNPAPTDGKALSAALYKLGVNPAGQFDVEYMLDGLVTHAIHVRVMDDIDAKYGNVADENYHAVLTQAMTDLKVAYGL